MKFIANDGGRRAAGFKGDAGDCVTRSIAIASELPYADIYKAMAKGNANQRQGKRPTSGGRAKSARNGIYTQRKWFKDYMRSLGFSWTPTMAIGSGCKIHLRAAELPAGRIVVAVSKHYTAVIDGVINDTFNPDRGGTRCVYGYWSLT